MQRDDHAIIIPLAWPDNLVASAYETYDDIMSWFNLCRNGFYKVGHAAMLLVRLSDGTIEYFDFGRYIAPKGYGRIRSVETDPELYFDIQADVTNDQIVNLEEILIYTSKQPHTHGAGTLYAGQYPGFSFEAVKKHVRKRQKHLIKYGAFTIGGSNCSRFVSQTMSRFLPFPKNLQLLYPWYGTPSPLGNIFNCMDKTMFIVKQDQVRSLPVAQFYTQYKILKKKLSFTKECSRTVPPKVIARTGHIYAQQKPDFLSPDAQWLGGIGSGAWHEIRSVKGKNLRFRRVQENGHIDWEGIYQRIGSQKMDWGKPYQFQFGTTCAELRIKQENQLFHYRPISMPGQRLHPTMPPGRQEFHPT